MHRSTFRFEAAGSGRRFPVLALAAAVFAVVALLALTAPAPALAQDSSHEGGDHEGGDHGMAGEAPSAEEQAMMEAWAASMAPGEPHAKLAETTGDWNLEIEFWMAPGAEPTVSEGTATRTMILDGRVLEERVEAAVMGQVMHGLGHTGYDNVTDQYWSTWTDDMSTGLYSSTGSWDEEKGGVVMKGEGPDPMSSSMKPMKSVITWPDENTEVLKQYGPGPDGEMYLAMKITYTRAD